MLYITFTVEKLSIPYHRTSAAIRFKIILSLAFTIMFSGRHVNISKFKYQTYIGILYYATILLDKTWTFTTIVNNATNLGFGQFPFVGICKRP